MTSSFLVLLLALAGDLDAAEKALAAGKPRDALRLLGDLAESDDVDVRVYIVEGRAYLALREYEAAVEPLLRASDARPEDKALARDAAYACWGSARGVHAMAYLNDARRLARRAGDALLLADLHYAAGDFEEALKAYRTLLDREDTRLRVQTRIAECLRQAGKEEEAKEAYGAALEEALRREDLASAWRMAFGSGRGGRLVAWLNEKLAADPENVDYRRYRGFARASLLMYAEAAEDLRTVLAQRPADLAVKDQLSTVLAQHGTRQQIAGEIEEAERLAREVLDKEPRREETWQRLGWLAGYHWSNGAVERSYSILKYLRGIDPEDSTTGLNFGAMARRLGRYGEAQEAYDTLLEADASDPDVLNDYAILRDGMGLRDAAVRLWKRVLDEEADNLNALENLMTHTWEQGDQKALTEYLERGLQAARDRGGPVDRWLWFRDRRHWAPAGFGKVR